jgi:hypothetical protein
MLHWDDELERRMAPLRAKVEAENRKIAELQSKLFHAEMEALRLGWYLKRMEEENRRLQEMLQAAALGQGLGRGGPGRGQGDSGAGLAGTGPHRLPQGRAPGGPDPLPGGA